MLAQGFLYLFNLNLNSARIDDVIFPPDNSELYFFATVNAFYFPQLCPVVRQQRPIANQRCVDDQASVIIERHIHTIEWFIPATRSTAAERFGGRYARGFRSFRMYSKRHWEMIAMPLRASRLSLPHLLSNVLSVSGARFLLEFARNYRPVGESWLQR